MIERERERERESNTAAPIKSIYDIESNIKFYKNKKQKNITLLVK